VTPSTPIDPVFEQALREMTARVQHLIREAGKIAAQWEQNRIKAIVGRFEDYDERGNAVLVDLILDEIEREDKGEE